MEFLRQKLGPLEVWQWGALGLALLLGYWYWKKSGPFAASADTSGVSAPAATGDTSSPMSGDLGALADRSTNPTPPNGWNGDQGGDPHGLPAGLGTGIWDMSRGGTSAAPPSWMPSLAATGGGSSNPITGGRGRGGIL